MRNENPTTQNCALRGPPYTLTTQTLAVRGKPAPSKFLYTGAPSISVTPHLPTAGPSVFCLNTMESTGSRSPHFNALRRLVLNVLSCQSPFPRLLRQHCGRFPASSAPAVFLSSGSASAGSSSPQQIPLRYKCFMCSSKFADKLERTVHFYLKHPQGPYTCVECGRNFSTIIKLRDHVKADHPNILMD